MENSKRFWTGSPGRGFLLGAVALVGMVIAGGGDARAWTLTTLWSFCAQGTSTCPDGQYPNGLIGDGSGGFYGTTENGGAHGQGTVFQLLRNPDAGSQQAWTVKTLYAFCAEGGAACTDGAQPINWNLLKDQWGNLYGTTIDGGANTANAGANGYLGTVFELSPKVGADGQTTWTHKTLHNFCAEGGPKCTDGKAPVSQLIMDSRGNLYGTATEGGVQNPNCIDGSCGVVFELVRNFDADGQDTWTYKVLHTFCEQGGTTCADGSNTHSGLLMTPWGRLYGDTARGGAHTTDNLMGGTVFELTPSFNDDGQRKWTFKTLYSFCAQSNCSDGAQPNEQKLLMDEAGSLFGVATMGGVRYSNCYYPPNEPPSTAGCGTVFELTPSGDRTSWTEKTLYRFCEGGGICSDGATPPGGLIRDAGGRLYGTTIFGGAYGTIPDRITGGFAGTVFSMTPKGNAVGETSWSHEVLYSFCAQGGANCTDGEGPYDLLTMQAGHIIGTTGFGGGAYGYGTVFELPAPNANPPEIAAETGR